MNVKAIIKVQKVPLKRVEYVGIYSHELGFLAQVWAGFEEVKEPF